MPDTALERPKLVADLVRLLLAMPQDAEVQISINCEFMDFVVELAFDDGVSKLVSIHNPEEHDDAHEESLSGG